MITKLKTVLVLASVASLSSGQAFAGALAPSPEAGIGFAALAALGAGYIALRAYTKRD